MTLQHTTQDAHHTARNPQPTTNDTQSSAHMPGLTKNSSNKRAHQTPDQKPAWLNPKFKLRLNRRKLSNPCESICKNTLAAQICIQSCLPQWAQANMLKRVPLRIKLRMHPQASLTPNPELQLQPHLSVCVFVRINSVDVWPGLLFLPSAAMFNKAMITLAK